MREYEVIVEGRVREVYTVHAESEEQAREMWESGDIFTPTMTEVFDTEVIEVEDTRGGGVNHAETGSQS